ncbi:MAG TPA: hypothetical protein VEB40_14450, partial [Flavipsychrobacter sp.]|nr:hypothetical protein [Flavipsychrobacter sp.]
CSALVTSVLPINEESFLGNLQLQAEGRTNLCYCSDIFLDRPQAMITTFGFADNPEWMKKALEQSTVREPEPLEIAGCHLIYGCYKDIIGKNLNTDLQYRVTFYIWIERPD